MHQSLQHVLKRHALKLSAVALTTLSLAAVAPAQQVNMLPAADGDLVATRLVAPMGLKASHVPTDAVAVSWALPADKALAAPQSFVATSKEYWVDVTAADLKAGVSLFAQAPQALVRLNPAPGQKNLAGLVIDPRSFTLTDPSKRQLNDGEGMEQMATYDQLKAASAPFAEGTVAFRLRSELGAGTFGLKAASIPAGRYVLHVLDQGSPVELALKANRADYLHGDSLNIETSFIADGLKVAMQDVSGYVTSPAGRSWPVRFEATGSGSHKASLPLDALEAPARGLWEAHVAVQGKANGVALRRYVKVAFNVALPSAAFTGNVEKIGVVDGLAAVRLGVHTAAAGRYEVRGVLFGTALDGSMQPIAIGHSANWLEAGEQALMLGFDANLIDASGLQMPFEVRDLSLIDQGTMGLLHRQGRGLRVE